jgi:ubiquinone/menaquinone biosynthesis C-methylase UbiE
MSDATLQAQIDAANAYEEIMVPALFEEWTEPLLDATGIKPGQRLLDVACGTGVLARAASPLVGPNGSVVGLDPNPGMLAVAAQLAPAVDWQLGAVEALPFPGASFDAVVCQFGMMFFADRPAAIGEMLRVLKPGGALAFALWDTLENSPAYGDDKKGNGQISQCPGDGRGRPARLAPRDGRDSVGATDQPDPG